MKGKSLLDQLDVNIDHVEENLRSTILYLFNLVEEQAAENKILREKNQQLRDEVNRLKGEQGKPDIKPKNRNNNTDVSSENERKKKIRDNLLLTSITSSVFSGSKPNRSILLQT